jgi:hypothetical protein
VCKAKRAHHPERRSKSVRNAALCTPYGLPRRRCNPTTPLDKNATGDDVSEMVGYASAFAL